MNTTDKNMFVTDEGKQWLKSHLNMGPVLVTFLKKDGTERTMKCTLAEQDIPVIEKKTERTKTVNEDVCPVYDIEAAGWRSFRYDSIKEVRFEL